MFGGPIIVPFQSVKLLSSPNLVTNSTLTFRQTVGNALVTELCFFTFFQFFVKSEGSRYYKVKDMNEKEILLELSMFL